MKWSRCIPGTIVGMAVLCLLLSMTAPRSAEGELSLDDFASIPVYSEGRLKPIDTVAKANLMIISKRQTFKDLDDRSQPAIRWLLEALVSGEYQDREKSAAWKSKVFRIENTEVVSFLGLQERPGSWRYSLLEIGPQIEKFEKEVVRAEAVNPKKRELFDQKILELSHNIQLYLKLSKGREPLILPTTSSDELWKSSFEIRTEVFQQALLKLRSEIDVQKLGQEELIARVRAETDRIVAADYPAAGAWERILVAYHDKKPDEFAQAVTDFRKLQGKLPSRAEGDARFEVFFNNFAPFYQCTVLYILVFLLCCAGWIAYPDVLNRSAFWLGVLTLLLHTCALLGRMYLMGRPPVTNLYSSAVFIGWGCVGLGLFLEWLFRNGLGIAVASVLGAATTLVAHHLAESKGDTMESLEAVLDTNFWLATHVTCVTLGYSATFFAGFLGLLFIILGLFTNVLDQGTFKSLAQMIYGVICFATLLSFVGTVLGGIWADQSWGRFWGWDPKENGALLIVLMNALILHARWGGLVKQRGMAVLTLVGNMVTGWSWFGTNQLSVGLHAYGFNKTLADGLTLFWISQLVCIGVGLVPLRHWKSYGQAKPELPRAPSERRKSVGGIRPATA